jgi:prefoldin subunit 5
MMDVDNVMESLRRRVAELQGKLEAEMATAAQLPDALDQVRRKGQSQQVVANASRAGF